MGGKGSVKIVSLVILLDMKGDGGKGRANLAFHFLFSVIYTHSINFGLCINKSLNF